MPSPACIELNVYNCNDCAICAMTKIMIFVIWLRGPISMMTFDTYYAILIQLIWFASIFLPAGKLHEKFWREKPMVLFLFISYSCTNFILFICVSFCEARVNKLDCLLFDSMIFRNYPLLFQHIDSVYWGFIFMFHSYLHCLFVFCAPYNSINIWWIRFFFWRIRFFWRCYEE